MMTLGMLSVAQSECTHQCLSTVRYVYGRWDSLDAECKMRMKEADGLWDDTTMTWQREDAKRLCHDLLCTVEDDLMDLYGGMERDILVYCKPFAYYEAPSPAPPLVSDVPIAWHFVLPDTAAMMEEVMEDTIQSALGMPMMSVTCDSWLQRDAAVAYECTILSPTEYAPWACSTLEVTVGNAKALAQSLGTHVASTDVDCSLVSRWIRPPPLPPPPPKRPPSRSRASPPPTYRPNTRDDTMTFYIGAAIVTLFLNAASIGWQWRATRTRRRPPFSLRVGKNKRIDVCKV